MSIQTVGTPALWIGFIVFVLLMVLLDLVLFHRKAHEVSIREALVWTFIWVALALAFNVGVYFMFGTDRALEFLAGYLIEKALSVDNLFVFLVIFSYFSVPAAYQHRVLLWGILGALVMRAVFIVLGAALIQTFHWIIYVFGAFLVYTGAKLLLRREESMDPQDNPVLKFFRRFVRSVPDYRGERFSVIEAGRRHATPLLMVLVVIEGTDVMFAVDSIPAVFAVTRDPFIVFTSNIFAIMGLRALFFVLAGMMGKFHYLKAGLGLVLGFVGVKMLVSGFLHIPISISLGVISLLLAGSIVASIIWPKKSEQG